MHIIYSGRLCFEHNFMLDAIIYNILYLIYFYIIKQIRNSTYNHLFASLKVRRKFCKWLAWYLRNSISSALFLSSTSFRSLISFSRISLFFFSSYARYSRLSLRYCSSLIWVSSSGVPCSDCSCLRMENVNELSYSVS